MNTSDCWAGSRNWVCGDVAALAPSPTPPERVRPMNLRRSTESLLSQSFVNWRMTGATTIGFTIETQGEVPPAGSRNDVSTGVSEGDDRPAGCANPGLKLTPGGAFVMT